MELIDNSTEKLHLSSEDDDTLYCEICSDTGEEFIVHGYCTNCNEYMCKNCFDYHRKPKPTRNHILLLKNAMPKPTERPTASVSPDVCTELCKTHPAEIAAFYCETHDEFFCNSCAATTHKTCEFLYIPDAAKDFANSAELEKTFSDLNAISKLCEENIDHAAKNSAKSDNQLTAAKKSVETYIENVQKVLSGKAEKIYTKMEEINTDNKDNMSNVSETCKSTKSESETLKQSLQALCDKKQFCQLYTETKKAAKAISELDLTVTNAGNVNKIQEYKCQCDKRLFQLVTNSSLFICIDPNDKKRLFPLYQSVMVSESSSRIDNDVPTEQAPNVPETLDVPEPNFPPPVVPPRRFTTSESIDEISIIQDDEPIYELIEDRHK
ncbi:transcription intermediary factor 1-alpha-like [Mercenaria mercenaria]|uniref:transcription intermediary factor 1-alpha-like n=1 Tax=Mercenaria mercenaria TaxID=6596 RepID=UPI00234F21DF|nr:transcription intermediary factor 1-alpha-like [Mercenaria mercenaria]